MTFTSLLLTNLAVVMGMMFLVWLLSLPLRNVSIVDIVWGAGFALVAMTTWLATESAGPSRWLLPVMAGIWGVRLSVYLAWRNIGKGEDKRYAAMRERRGPSFALSSLLIVFVLQGFVMWVVSLPLQAGIFSAEPGWSWMHVVGPGIWLIGLLFESIGDLQLALFKSKPENAGRVMNRGLWRYTRHPNYFGDFLVWWGLYVVAIAHGVAVWTIISPVLMSIFLIWVSGVTLLEKSLHESRPGYAEYCRETNAFFPWIPKNWTEG